MSDLTPEQIEERKRHMYDNMAPRRRKFVDRIGYENWDPFPMPFDPIDIRVDATGHTAQELTLKFMAERGKGVGPDFLPAITEFTITLVSNPERIRPLFEFCHWYREQLENRGLKL